MANLTAINKSEKALNSKVADSIAQANTEVVGLAPANASGNYYQGNSQALGLAALNATNTQQQNNINLNASTPLAINTLYSIDTGTDGTGMPGIFDKAPKLKFKRVARVKFMKK